MTIVLFDVDGVLMHGYHAKPEFRKCWDENLEEDFFISRSDFTKHFIRGVFEAEVLTGKRDLYSALQEVLPSIGHSDDPQLLIDYWMKKDSNINTELIPYVEKLSKLPDVSLFIATNQENVRAQYLMEEVGFSRYFQDIFNSARVGYMKPDRKFYERVEGLLCRQKGEKIILFDDNQSVVDGALAAGWEAHQFDVPEDLFKSKIVGNVLRK